MAYIPKMITKTNTSPEVLNAIRNDASQDYRNHIPLATPDAESVRTIGAIIMDYPAIQNEFLSALINRIALTRVTSKLYQNPYAMFKKGIMENGETVEEVFVDLIRPYQYNPSTTNPEKELFQKYAANVKSAFHIMNYQVYYPVTVGRNELAQAFLTWEGVDNLISKIVEAVYTSENYDEQNVMLYMLAQKILAGELTNVNVGEFSEENKHTIAGTFRGVSNQLTFLSRNYNLAGVHTHTPRDNQYIFMSAMYNGIFDASELASAFNMDKANFFGHLILVPGFAEIDFDRLDVIFDGCPDYKRFTEGELTTLKSVAAVILDREWWQVYDNLIQFTEQYVPNLLRWNYFLHSWKTYGISPFANAVVFSSEAPSITSVTVEPETVEDVDVGDHIQFNAKVVTAGPISQAVRWSVTSGIIADVPMTQTGYMSIMPEAQGSYTVRATSVADANKYGEATVTIKAKV